MSRSPAITTMFLDDTNTGRRIKYKEFAKFDSAASALEEIAGVIEGKVTPKLASLLNEFKDEKKISLAVAEKQLGNAIVKLPDLNIKTISDSSTNDLFRAIRENLTNLIPGMLPANFKEMSLGLSHSLSRHKLKFSPDKVDVMIVHAIALLDDLDKELNTYAMRVREWYGWHFPELAKILTGNLVYAKVILAMGMRSNAVKADLTFLEEPVEAAVKAAADISMGTEITEEDLENIKLLAEQVVRYGDYRDDLARYLESRMKAIAPNMTELVGHLVGARLIAHAGSLMNLAKNPGSTIQILGAEKALFRALKTKHATPKYGLLYHASLVGQASGKNKGKIARQLASKVALGVRTDALHEPEDDEDYQPGALGALAFAKIQRNLAHLEGKPIKSGISIAPPQASQFDLKEVRKYNIDADGQVVGEPMSTDQEERPSKEKKDKKDKKKKALVEEVSDVEMASSDEEEEDDEDMEETPAQNGTSAPRSPSLASVSEDSDEEAAAEKAKKAKKRGEATPDKAARRAERKAQEKRQAEREERRHAKKDQEKRRSDKSAKASTATPGKLTDADMERLAKVAGMSTSKFTRKYERGQIKVNSDGTLDVKSKKELKADEAGSKSSKRKLESEDEGEDVRAKEEKPKKKKKKHQQEA